MSSYGDRDEMVKLNIAGLKEVINEYRDDFIGKIFIGRRNGFFEGEDEALKLLQQEYQDNCCLRTCKCHD